MREFVQCLVSRGFQARPQPSRPAHTHPDPPSRIEALCSNSISFPPEELIMAHLSFNMRGARKGMKAQLQAFESDEEEESTRATTLQPAELQEQGNEAASCADWSLALRRWDEALAAHAANPHVLHEQKAQVYLEVGDPWRAIQSASTATQLQPGWAEAHLTLARAQLSFGEPELALASMDTVLTLQPGNAEAAEEIATVRMLVLQRKKEQQRGAAGAGAGGGGSCRRLKVVSGGEPGAQ